MTPKIRSWPEIDGTTKIQGFPGYKAGMTHAFVVDYRPTSTTSGQEVRVPVTVVEVPAVTVCGLRFYEETHEGLKTMGEVWASNVNNILKRKLPIPNRFNTDDMWDDIDRDLVDEVRTIVHTHPEMVPSIPSKTPEVMELRIGGGTISERIEMGEEILGKEINIDKFGKSGNMVDVSAITKGKGFQGHVKRWGVKLLSHKNSKSKRNIGTTGVFIPGYIRPTVPQAGQMGFHQRTEFNKRILKTGEDGSEITPSGGFVNYGEVNNSYVMLHGSIPGPSKRLTVLRDPIRRTGVEVEEPNITYISTESKQGV
jgi:large subunit ribosomal protein L3